MSHSAGLPGLDEPIEGEQLYDHTSVADALARQAPWWKPGSRSGYHAATQGYLLGEVVARVTGKSLGTYFRDEIAAPLAADFHIGTPVELDPRIGELIPPDSTPLGTFASESIAGRTFASPRVDASASGTRAWRAAELPALNGHGNARSVVRVQTAMANEGSAFGKRVLSEDGTKCIFDVQTDGKDLVLGVPIVFGMGYGLTNEALPMGPNKRIAYWGGWGGSTIVVDQDARLCVSYVMNRMAPGLLGDTRGFGLLQAVYASLSA